MMINTNYAEIVANAKARNATYVSFDKAVAPINAITAEKDTFTLSDRAIAKMNGSDFGEPAPTYINPKTAREFLTENTASTRNDEESTQSSKFNTMMLSILDKRLGIDREKLEELDAMIKAIADDENMSPEEKQKTIEKLEELREKIIEESMDIQKEATQTFHDEE
ncbi:hypothetical protein Q4493_09165 [Colwellia sp. 1_MG-2023]|uniref:hypothetical protein n=1 Tax=Colwellia sp. 1_MG-2023 TaxID=3062649 RepID=UPI0026E2BB59|nr:hypothetical protein [Colwellia sp. 1_MG-2023]MDO6445940.1 hypothetical protein [Colwellia sp. 1_MG-2023]